ncbi:ATPase [Roseinatronobacter sp.]|uniref:ATPase n=1 Tax=Roseinatronobacter sp. TaxID=1945755 RepID=UPI0025F22B14|nr:ATPase [Roseibaca sp.]
MNVHSPTINAPTVPRNLDDTGLTLVMMRDILLKTMYRMSLSRISEIARTICLPIPQTIELIDQCRQGKLLEATASLTANTSSEASFQLTEAGKGRAMDALSQSEYYGAMPVPLGSYAEQIKKQSIRNVQITRRQLQIAMGDLILPQNLLSELGPAVSSGRSILMYGPPGNGKSSISNGIRAAMGDRIYVPRAVTHAGQIISVYDPIVHTMVETWEDDPNLLRQTGNRFDGRYVYCERPTVITGGELTLSMLDLTFNPVSRTYQAPLQFKATGGVFIIDDLGRQEEPPQSIVNRWIVPMEMNYDILALQSGEKFVVPFDTLVIFSTNFHPNEIFDQAALRRIFYKIKIDGPSQQDFLKIFALVAKKRGLPLDEDAIIHLIKTKYPSIHNIYANYQPIFLVDQMIAICDFEGKPRRMSPELIDRAWKNMFVETEEIVR